MTHGALLDPLPGVVEALPLESDDMEGVHHFDRGRSSSTVADSNPVKPSMATCSMPSRKSLSRAASQSLKTCFDRPAPCRVGGRGRSC